MRPRLYISWGNWLGAQAGALLDGAVRTAYGDQASSFYSGEIKEGDHWFALNEDELGKASAATVLITSDGLQSRWQAYEFGRLRGRNVPCTLLLLNVPAHELGPTVYAHFNCSQPTNDVLLKVIRAGLDADVNDDDPCRQRNEEVAIRDLGFKLQCLIEAFNQLGSYLNLTGRSRIDRLRRNTHLENAVNGFCSAGLSEDEIAAKLRAEHIAGAVFIHLFDKSPCRALPRIEGSEHVLQRSPP